MLTSPTSIQHRRLDSVKKAEAVNIFIIVLHFPAHIHVSAAATWIAATFVGFEVVDFITQCEHHNPWFALPFKVTFKIGS
jgi:Na+-transporting NADH:ubiquinone oxidoreductase subunit NqrB